MQTVVDGLIVRWSPPRRRRVYLVLANLDPNLVGRTDRASWPRPGPIGRVASRRPRRSTREELWPPGEDGDGRSPTMAGKPKALRERPLVPRQERSAALGDHSPGAPSSRRVSASRGPEQRRGWGPCSSKPLRDRARWGHEPLVDGASSHPQSHTSSTRGHCCIEPSRWSSTEDSSSQGLLAADDRRAVLLSPPVTYRFVTAFVGSQNVSASHDYSSCGRRCR
jgi:hypothetical protein